MQRNEQRSVRTDLAIEARDLWNRATRATDRLPGVEARDYEREGLSITRVEINSKQGAEALGKPEGVYVTVELPRVAESSSFESAVFAVSEELRSMLSIKSGDMVLVAGLGNSAITPDAVGPKAVQSIMITRHLHERIPELVEMLRPVAAVAPGVLGTTGIESLEILRGIIMRTQPATLIVVDALASRSVDRLCRTVQLSDTGIVPGSGVGNSRAAINRETLGLPVIAIGLPTVVDAATLAAELAEKAGVPGASRELLSAIGEGLMVTPREIDARVSDAAKVLGYAINLALHDDLTIADIVSFLS